MIPIGLISIFIILISPMGDKIVTVLGNKYVKDLLSAFTSGRSEFWVYDLKYFLNQIFIFNFLEMESHLYLM